MTNDPKAVWSDVEPDDDAAPSLFQRHRAEGHEWNACPSPDLVQASRMGTLPADLQERVSKHVERCIVCQALGEALDDSSVNDLVPEEQTRIQTRIRRELRSATLSVSRYKWWHLFAAAAVVVLVAGAS